MYVYSRNSIVDGFVCVDTHDNCRRLPVANNSRSLRFRSWLFVGISGFAAPADVTRGAPTVFDLPTCGRLVATRVAQRNGCHDF